MLSFFSNNNVGQLFFIKLLSFVVYVVVFFA